MSEPPHQEVEVKLSCTAAVMADVMAALQQAAGSAPKIKHLHTVYFDTADLSLRRKGASLRLRETEGEIPQLGFKSPALANALRFHRYEVEVVNPGEQVDLTLFDDLTLKILSDLVGKKKLQRQFGVKVKRQVLRIPNLGAEIEIAADQGAVHGVRRTAEISELELELKAGPERALYEYAAALVRKFPLTLSFISKSDRGYGLSGRPAAVAPLPQEPELSGQMSLDDMIAATLSHALYRFTFHWDGLRQSDHPEATHQMRVALRHLRTAVAMFSKVRPCQEFATIKQGAKELVGILGHARNFDVLADVLAKNSKDSNFTAKSLAGLRALIVEKQVESRQAARTAINSRPASLFVLETQLIITSRAWCKSAETTETGEGKALPSITLILDQLHARVLKKGRGFLHLSDAELHELRLSIKALSFATVTFAGVLKAGEDAKNFSRLLAKLQRKLGVLNDSVFELEFCEQAARSSNPEVRAGAAVLRSALVRSQAGGRDKIKPSWAEFKAMKPYWH